MKSSALSTIAAIILAAAAPAAHAERPAQSAAIAFRYAPPEGTEFVQRVHTTREKLFDGLGKQVNTSRSETAVSVRRTSDGYRLTAKPLAMTLTRDGEEVNDPVSQLLHGLTLTYRVGLDGQLQGIDGFGELAESLRATFPEQVAEALAPMLSEQAMIAKETAEWNGRFGDYAGREFARGQSIAAEVPYTLPNGEALVYQTRTSFEGSQTCAAGACVRVTQTYDSDSSALAESTADSVGEIVSALGEDVGTPAVSKARLSGSTDRLIDPRTMLIYSEELRRTIRMTMELPGRGAVPMTMNETRRYSYEYR